MYGLAPCSVVWLCQGPSPTEVGSGSPDAHLSLQRCSRPSCTYSVVRLSFSPLLGLAFLKLHTCLDYSYPRNGRAFTLAWITVILEMAEHTCCLFQGASET